MTTATVLRPNSTVTAPTSVTGAASSHAATSDDSDSSYATMLGADGVYAYVGLTSFTLPTGAVTRSLSVGARVKASQVPPGYASFNVYSPTYQSGDPLSSITVQTTSIGFVTHTATPQAVTLTQAQIDGLEVGYSAPVAGLGSVHFAELYSTLVYVAKPVVAVDALTDPVTTTTYPSVTWTNTLDADGGFQRRYQMKVFDQATYGAGFSGLDPATDTPYYDTGEVVTSKATARTNSLLDGDTYRAYVRVAQTVNGVSHWSDWAYDEFTVTLDTSDVDTVTTVADNTNAKITVTVARDALTEAWDYIEVQRSIDAGATWSDVRFATYVDATADADEFIVADYETGNTVSALYRARATRILSEQQITGAWVESTPAVAWTSTSTFLKVPEAPDSNTDVCFAHSVAMTRPARRGVFPILGTRLPVVVSDTRGAVVSQITIDVDTLVDAAAVISIFDNYDVVLIQTPTDQPFGSRYISAGSVDEIPQADEIVLPYIDIVLNEAVEVGVPADPSAGR